jgi:hypothetical protein
LAAANHQAKMDAHDFGFYARKLRPYKINYRTGVSASNSRKRQPRKDIPMNAIVIEHVPVTELPLAWRAKFAKSTDALVTVRIEEEAGSTAPAAEEFMTNDPLFGMWRDREDMADVAGYVRSIRASRFNDDGSQRN